MEEVIDHEGGEYKNSPEEDAELELITYRDEFDAACEYIVAQPDKIVLTYNGGETVPENRRYRLMTDRDNRPCAVNFGFNVKHLDSYVLVYHVDDLSTPLYKMGAVLTNTIGRRAFGVRGINQSDPLDAWNAFKIDAWRSIHPYGEEGKDKRISSRPKDKPRIKKRPRKPTSSDVSIMKALMLASSAGVEQIDELLPVEQKELNRGKNQESTTITMPDSKRCKNLEDIYHRCKWDPTYTKESFMTDIKEYY